jgi:hypothetical protein
MATFHLSFDVPDHMADKVEAALDGTDPNRTLPATVSIGEAVSDAVGALVAVRYTGRSDATPTS